jgi:hypothetical protein
VLVVVPSKVHDLAATASQRPLLSFPPPALGRISPPTARIVIVSPRAHPVPVPIHVTRLPRPTTVPHAGARVVTEIMAMDIAQVRAGASSCAMRREGKK